MSDISNNQNVIDLRDVISRFEELETELTEIKDDTSEQAGEMDLPTWFDAIDVEKHPADESIKEFQSLSKLLDECESAGGGDEKWRGNWYPITLIRDSYFEEYAEELADEIGAINKELSWPYTCIDWERAASELKMDYTSVDFDGVTYWVR